MDINTRTHMRGYTGKLILGGIRYVIGFVREQIFKFAYVPTGN